MNNPYNKDGDVQAKTNHMIFEAGVKNERQRVFELLECNPKVIIDYKTWVKVFPDWSGKEEGHDK